MPWTAARVGMRATRTPSARTCSAAAAAVCRRSASLGSRTTSRAWARRIASASSPLAGGSPGRASTVVAPASAHSPARPSPARPRRPRDAARSRGGAIRSAAKCVMRIRYGRPASTPASTAATRVVDVHVHVPQAVAADVVERVPESVEPGPQPGHRRVVRLQEVDHLEGGAALRHRVRPLHVRRAAVGGGQRRGRFPLAYGDGLARDRFDQGAEHGHQTPPARVDDARAAEHGQLVGGRVECGARPFCTPRAPPRRGWCPCSRRPWQRRWRQ